MDYEKAYSKALERANKFYEANTNEGYRQIFEEIFPELKESEDEKIRKEIISYIKSSGAVTNPNWIAWLEKQGEHIKFLESIQIGDEVTRNPDGVLVNLSQLKRKAKQGSQNLANSAWSEEDENMLTDVVDALKDLLSRNESYAYLEDHLDWLKSLKERYTWKPSDEQIKALEHVSLSYICAWLPEIQSLLNDLKKLTE